MTQKDVPDTPVSTCDRCSREMPPADAESCELCWGTFCSECLIDHKCEP